MIEMLVAYEMEEMTSDYLKQILKEGFIGFENDGHDQLIDAMKERGLL
jgi:hypothetical protein